MQLYDFTRLLSTTFYFNLPIQALVRSNDILILVTRGNQRIQGLLHQLFPECAHDKRQGVGTVSHSGKDAVPGLTNPIALHKETVTLGVTEPLQGYWDRGHACAGGTGTAQEISL